MTTSSSYYPTSVLSRLREPMVVILGSPTDVAELVVASRQQSAVYFQMDKFQSERVDAELKARSATAIPALLADLWDIPQTFQCAVLLAQQGGERELKIDMVEQASHVLNSGGTLIVVSDFERDFLFPGLLKKVFGKVHADTLGKKSVFWCRREKDRPRRRHEQIFHARLRGGESRKFLSRPGVFSYGAMDEGARALLEVVEFRPGEKIVDYGCGCGSIGIFAGLASGETAHVVFVDSNLRALQLAQHNANLNGLKSFQTVVSSQGVEFPSASVDLVLANPPYHARLSIARSFVESARRLLRPGGRFYLVTKQPDELGPFIAESFGVAEVFAQRGYTILFSTVPDANIV